MEGNEREDQVAQGLVRIHKVITRGLDVSIKNGTQYVQNGLPDPELQHGYLDYVQTMMVVIHAHHLGEDEISYPVFKQRIPAAPYDIMTVTHVQIAALLQAAEKAISGWSYKNDIEALRSLLKALHQIDKQWHPHIELEERHFSKQAIIAVMEEEEERQLNEAIGRHSQDHAVPGAMVLPFVLFNLEGADRMAMAANMPPAIANELIPFAWKDQWASMKPFFLE